MSEHFIGYDDPERSNTGWRRMMPKSASTMALFNLLLTVFAVVFVIVSMLLFLPDRYRSGGHHGRGDLHRVETRREARVFTSKHCNVYEIRIHDEYGFRTIVVIEPPTGKNTVIKCEVTS